MNSNFVSSYIPASFYLNGKDVLAGRECHESLAVADTSDAYRIIAARSAHLKTEERLQFPEGEQAFLENALLAHSCVAVLSSHGVLLAFSSLLPATGLLPVLIPDGDTETLSRALLILNQQQHSVCVSPRLSSMAATGGDLNACCYMLMEQISICNLLFCPEEDTDFRLHCAQIAGFAGCRVNVTELPVGALPITAHDRLRWSAFLLCTFLALRGDSAVGSKLHMENNTDNYRLQLAHTPERFRKAPMTSPRFRYLQLPCFSDIRLSKTERGLILEANLRAKAEPSALHTFPIGDLYTVICIELLY